MPFSLTQLTMLLRKTCFIPKENWLGIRVLGRLEAKNVSDESLEENLQINNHTWANMTITMFAFFSLQFTKMSML